MNRAAFCRSSFPRAPRTLGGVAAEKIGLFFLILAVLVPEASALITADAVSRFFQRVFGCICLSIAMVCAVMTMQYIWGGEEEEDDDPWADWEAEREAEAAAERNRTETLKRLKRQEELERQKALEEQKAAREKLANSSNCSLLAYSFTQMNRSVYMIAHERFASSGFLTYFSQETLTEENALEYVRVEEDMMSSAVVSDEGLEWQDFRFTTSFLAADFNFSEPCPPWNRTNVSSWAAQFMFEETMNPCNSLTEESERMCAMSVVNWGCPDPEEVQAGQAAGFDEARTGEWKRCLEQQLPSPATATPEQVTECSERLCNYLDDFYSFSYYLYYDLIGYYYYYDDDGGGQVSVTPSFYRKASRPSDDAMITTSNDADEVEASNPRRRTRRLLQNLARNVSSSPKNSAASSVPPSSLSSSSDSGEEREGNGSGILGLLPAGPHTTPPKRDSHRRSVAQHHPHEPQVEALEATEEVEVLSFFSACWSWLRRASSPPVSVGAERAPAPKEELVLVDTASVGSQSRSRSMSMSSTPGLQRLEFDDDDEDDDHGARDPHDHLAPLTPSSAFAKESGRGAPIVVVLLLLLFLRGPGGQVLLLFLGLRRQRGIGGP